MPSEKEIKVPRDKQMIRLFLIGKMDHAPRWPTEDCLILGFGDTDLRSPIFLDPSTNLYKWHQTIIKKPRSITTKFRDKWPFIPILSIPEAHESEWSFQSELTITNLSRQNKHVNGISILSKGMGGAAYVDVRTCIIGGVWTAEEDRINQIEFRRFSQMDFSIDFLKQDFH